MASTPGRPILASAPGRRSSVPAAPRQLLSMAGTGSAPSEGGCHLTNGCQVPQRCAAGNRRWRSGPEGGRVDADRVHGGRSKVHVPLAAAAWPRPRAFRLPPQPVPPPWWRERGSGRRGGPAEPAAGAASLCVLGPPPYDRPASWSITDEAAPLRVTPLRAGGQLLCGRRHRRRGVPVTGRCAGYCGRGECRRGARGRQHY